MGAPVCNINPKNPPPQSVAPQLPSIPLANDLASALAAINAIRQWVLQFTNLGSSGAGATNIAFVVRPGNFAEVPRTRQVTTTRIYDPNDPTQQTYIDVNQITGLEFANSLGQSIKWSQNS